MNRGVEFVRISRAKRLVLERWLNCAQFLRVLQRCAESTIEVFWKSFAGENANLRTQRGIEVSNSPRSLFS
jgi:hypothetical protein